MSLKFEKQSKMKEIFTKMLQIGQEVLELGMIRKCV